MFGAIGIGEIALILMVAFVVVGPEKLPDLARQLGRGVRTIKSQLRDLDSEFKSEMGDIRQSAGLDDTLKDWKNIKKQTEEAKADFIAQFHETETSKKFEGGPHEG